MIKKSSNQMHHKFSTISLSPTENNLFFQEYVDNIGVIFFFFHVIPFNKHTISCQHFSTRHIYAELSSLLTACDLMAILWQSV